MSVNPSKEFRLLLCRWLKANGLNPSVIPNEEGAVSRTQDTITVTEMVKDEHGYFLLDGNGEGNRVARRERTVPMLINWEEFQRKQLEGTSVPVPVDYEELLKKYMAFVRQEEGITFVEYMSDYPDNGFSSEERAELRKLHNKITGEA